MLGSTLHKTVMDCVLGVTEATCLFDRVNADLVDDVVENYLNIGEPSNGRLLTRRDQIKAATSLFYPKAADSDIETLARRSAALVSASISASVIAEKRVCDALKAEFMNGRKLSAVIQSLEHRSGVAYG